LSAEYLINIFWFRRDLRIDDNKGLYNALNSGLKVLPIFIFDKSILDDLEDRSDARIIYIYNQLTLLNKKLLKYHSNISILYGDPLSVFKSLHKKYNIKAVYVNEDYEPYAISRDKQIKNFLNHNGIEFYQYKDHVIFHKSDILNNNDEPYKVFSAYKKRWFQKFDISELRHFPSEEILQNLYNNQNSQALQLRDIGFYYKDVEFPENILDPSLIMKYARNRDYPNIDGTSKLGVHLRHGSLSIRKALKFGLEYSGTWVNELIWREFYSMILYHFPAVITKSFKIKYDNIPWLNNKEDFEKWCNGQTGYPIVDAGMRQLNATGFMHNRARMITASFLTKHLLIDWRWGEAYFAKKLLDYELASNNGGWQWSAGTGTDSQPYFRIFNPYNQTRTFDSKNLYIQKWLPEYDHNNYPKPIIDHTFARQRAINTYKNALR
jgi:deoxyribodipyrimidine photo-lyase